MSVPALRFKGFTEDWKKQLLGSIFSFKNGVNASKDQYGSGFKFINVLDIINNNFITYDNIIGAVDISTEEFLKNEVKYGDVLFQRSSETREEVGQSNVYIGDKSVTFGGFVIRGRGISEYYPHFFNYVLKTDAVRDEVTQRSGGSTRYNIGQESLNSVELHLPIISEQKIIANFLRAVDEKITQLTQKFELLALYKKGVMQQIFSQKLRFKYDDEQAFPEWNEYLLNDALIKNSSKNKRGEFTLVQSVSNKHGFINQDELFEDRVIASKDLSNYYVIKKSAFAYNPSRIDVGSLAYKKDDLTSVVSPLYVSFYAKPNLIIDKFLLNWFESESFKNQMNSSFEGSVRNTLSYDSLSKILISLPCIHEQSKIVTFLTAFDDKLKHTQNQLEAAKQYKQGLLQQMFV